MSKCIYCGKVAPKMSLVCDACAKVTTELPENAKPKYCWPYLTGCSCKDCDSDDQ